MVRHSDHYIQSRNNKARVIAGFVLFGVGLLAIFDGASDANPLIIVLGLAPLILSGAVLAPYLSDHLAHFAAFSIFFPGEKLNKPLPQLSIPQARRAMGQLEASLEAYNEVVAEHPDCLQAWLEMSELLFVRIQDLERARLHRIRALAALQKPEDKAAFERTHLLLLEQFTRQQAAAAAEPFELKMPDPSEKPKW
jgi:tetratricopeptide (TPR) repeat protein